MNQRRRWQEEPMRMSNTRILTPRISAGEKFIPRISAGIKFILRISACEKFIPRISAGEFLLSYLAFDLNTKVSRCSICSDEFASARELNQHQKETDHGYSLACKASIFSKYIYPFYMHQL